MSSIRRTHYAQAALDYAALFAETFADTAIDGDCVRRPHLGSPDGMSTSGGKFARQHITLRPDVQALATLTVGAVDVAKGAATLRSFEYLQQAYMARFGDRPFDLDETGYRAFFTDALDFFSRQGMWVDVQTDVASSGLITKSRQQPKSKRFIAAIAVSIALVVAAIAAAIILVIRFHS